jgi:AraC-like DNA-binding protein
MDLLSDVLSALELKGWLHSRTEVASPWRFDFAASPDSIFHILSCGGGYLLVEGEPTPVRLEDGDVIVFPAGQAHSICDDLASPLTQVVHLDYDAHRGYQVFPCEGAGPKMVMLCGAFHFEHLGDFPLLQRLPKVIHIPGAQGRMAQGLAEIVALIARESASAQPGADVMLRRLTELLFIQLIRVWIDQHAQASGGWVAALRDRPISSALGLIHQSVERAWKVEELAAAVGLSRSAFSARFSQLVGEPPIQYLTHWRMHRARHLLKNEVRMETIAKLLGYDSEVAFRKAFKREVGMPPARYRKFG